MKHQINSLHNIRHPVAIAYIADYEPHAMLSAVLIRHISLLLFVSAENDHLLRIFFQEPLGYSIAERTGSAGYQNYLAAYLPLNVCAGSLHKAKTILDKITQKGLLFKPS